VNAILFFLPIYSNASLSGRFSGLMANPNGLGLLAMFSYALIDWVRTHEETIFTRRFFIFFKLILFFLIIVTASRTALFSVIAFELTNRFLQYHILLIIGLIGIVFFSILLNNIEIEVITRSLGLSDHLRVSSLETASGRTEVWPVAFEEFKKHPWLGQGMMYDNYFIEQYASNKFGENYARHWNGVWNSYLSLALNVGIIGLTLFGYFWYRLFRSARDKVFRVAFLVMILFSAITESWMAASMNAFMPLIFLIWALQIEPDQNTVEADT
jgi:O-antigen ligase